MRNVALRLAYDGTDFAGSQWQQQSRTVQGELEQAWSRLTQESRRFTFAGRTDAGVHAQGQAANVHTETHHSLEVIQRALNALLPHDIAILDVWEAEASFHARYSAIWRWYRYLIQNEAVVLPQMRRYVLHVAQQLDMAAMQTSLGVLPGNHDFAAFATGVSETDPTVRHCSRATCQMIEWLSRPVIAIDLVANGFLRQMVRAIVGTLLLVGSGRMPPAAFEQVFRGRDRRRAGPTAAAHGLTLMAVGYTERVEGET